MYQFREPLENPACGAMGIEELNPSTALNSVRSPELSRMYRKPGSSGGGSRKYVTGALLPMTRTARRDGSKRRRAGPIQAPSRHRWPANARQQIPVGASAEAARTTRRYEVTARTITASSSVVP